MLNFFKELSLTVSPTFGIYWTLYCTDETTRTSRDKCSKGSFRKLYEGIIMQKIDLFNLKPPILGHLWFRRRTILKSIWQKTINTLSNGLTCSPAYHFTPFSKLVQYNAGLQVKPLFRTYVWVFNFQSVKSLIKIPTIQSIFCLLSGCCVIIPL